MWDVLFQTYDVCRLSLCAVMTAEKTVMLQVILCSVFLIWISCVFLPPGTIGFFACFWFVTKIYSVVKVD